MSTARLFKKNVGKNIRIQRISKSDWDISSTSGSEEDVILLRDVKNLNFEDREDLIKSQYFDALETIAEEDEIEPCEHVDIIDDDESWENLDDNVTTNGLKKPKVRKNGYVSGPRKDNARKELKNLPSHIKQRISALRKLHFKRQEVELQFYEEINCLEKSTLARRLEPLHEMRARIVSGPNTHRDRTSTIETENMFDFGVPMFWCHAMLCSQTIRNIIQDHDIPVLKFLQDIRVQLDPQSQDFKLVFQFGSQNPFFSNSILTKEYQVKLNKQTGPQVFSCTGCKINWMKGKNLTIRPLKKLDKFSGEPLQKWSKCNSFFNFFSPPKQPYTNKETSRVNVAALLEAHFDIGLYFKEVFIPKATVFFLSNELVDLRGGNNNYNLGENKKAQPPQTQQTNSDTKNTDFLANTSEQQDSFVDDSVTNDDDPILGRWRMQTSENFDDFMKALNVGLMKRKMANSVTPVNVIEFKNGFYTIRTETTLRTSEIQFKLNEPFKETTLDGRVTDTIAIREGNRLVLEQHGNKLKNEKDSRMIREFQGNTMIMELIVDNIVCKRVYQRIPE